MSRSPEKLEREAEAKRQDVERSIAALKSRMSFGQIAEEVGSYVHADQARDAARNVGRQMRDNPLALGLIGAGVAWLMFGEGVRERANQYYAEGNDSFDTSSFGGPRADRYPRTVRSHSRSDFTAGRVPSGASADDDDGEGVADRLRHGADAAKDKARHLADDASHAAGSARDKVAGLAADAGEAIEDAYDRTRRGMHDLADSARDTGYRAAGTARRYSRGARHAFTDALQNDPLIVGAFAVAIGAAIGAALPPTRTEDEWLGAERDHLRDDAVAYAETVKNEAVHVAEETYRSATDAARKEGLAPTGEGPTLAEKVEHVAKAATDTAKSEVDKRV
jgi:hypothetical protein